MIRRDMPEVLAIEQKSFEFPWCENDFLRCLRQRNCIGMVAEHDDRVVGFMIYELHKARLHVLNFAVSSRFRRLGVGAQMIDKLIGKLSTQRRNRILLEVRETNLAAQLFFRSSGFRAVSVLREFYEDTPEDAYLMQFRYRGEQAPALQEEQFAWRDKEKSCRKWKRSHLIHHDDVCLQLRQLDNCNRVRSRTAHPDYDPCPPKSFRAGNMRMAVANELITFCLDRLA